MTQLVDITKRSRGTASSSPKADGAPGEQPRPRPFARLEARIAGREARIGLVGRSEESLWLAERLDAAGFATLVYRRGPGRREAGAAHGPANTGSARALSACDVVIVAAGNAADAPAAQVADARHVLSHWPTEAVQRLLLVESSASLASIASELTTAANRWHRLGSTVALAFAAQLTPPRSRGRAGTVVLAGHDDRAAELAAMLLAAAGLAVNRTPAPAVASAADELRRAFTFVNAAYASEFAAYCASLGIEYAEVARLAATKPFGFMQFAGGQVLSLEPPGITRDAEGLPTPIARAACAEHDHAVARAVEAIASAVTSLAGTNVLMIAPGAGRAGTAAMVDALEDAGARVTLAVRRREPVDDLPTAQARGSIAVALRPLPTEGLERIARKGWRVIDLSSGDPGAR